MAPVNKAPKSNKICFSRTPHPSSVLAPVPPCSIAVSMTHSVPIALLSRLRHLLTEVHRVEPNMRPALDECRVLEPVVGQRIPNNHDFFVDARRGVGHDRVGAEGDLAARLPRVA